MSGAGVAVIVMIESPAEAGAEAQVIGLGLGASESALVTVKVWSSCIAEEVSKSAPSTLVSNAPCLICKRTVPIPDGVTVKKYTLALEVLLTFSIVIGAVPAFSKSADVTVLASISSLKLTV